MKHIILDTNFLLIPGEVKVDIFGEIDRVIDDKTTLYIIDRTQKELESLMKGRGKKRAAAKLAFQLIKLHPMKIICTNLNKHVDLLILQEIKESDRDYIVATQDAALKQKLKRRRIPHLVLRKKQYVELIIP